MSLIKSFNFSFLKQNIRKSKGAIILSIIIVPLILSMYLVVAGLNEEIPSAVSTTAINVIDLIFMYVIPFVYSALLFGFVFKKSSTDFMNSMPINRKTMFVTNTIGGIGLITIIQILVALTAFIWGAIFKNIIIFPSAILDTIIISWISYVFVFIVANLAISFSGTQLAHFVSIVLILFLVPVCIELLGGIRKENTPRASHYDSSYGYETYSGYDISIANGHKTTYYDTLDEVKDYTMPFKMFRYGIKFSFGTIARMIGLSVLYFIIGLKLYQNKKMEHSEETFASQKMHIFVKALTLIPVLLFVDYVNTYSESLTAIVIVIILCAIYYYVFDIISKRKISLKTTVFSFVATVFIIQAVATFIGNIEYNEIEIDADDIKAISIGTNSKSENSMYSFNYSDDNVFDGDYYMENSQILNLILDGRYSVTNDKDNEINYYTSSESKNIEFNIKLKNGKEYFIDTYISAKNYKEIMSVLSRNEEYVEHMKKKITNKNGIIEVGNDIVDYKTKKKINKLLKEDVELISTDNSSINCITKTIYQNHRLVEYTIPLINNDELVSVVADFANEQAIKNIKGYQYGISVEVYNSYSNSISNSFYDDDKILDFMEEHAADEFNPAQKYYIISGSVETRDGYKRFRFYTNSTKEVDKIVNSSQYKRSWDY